MGRAKARAGALHGVRVLDFTRAVAGGYCTRLLCDMGAQVIKIEAPEIGDGIRILPPFHGRTWSLPPSMSPTFVHCNAGKRSIGLDLRRPEAIDVVRRIVPHVDVVVENFTRHVMPGLGLAYENLRPLRPDLVMCSITGFGMEGPLADTPCADAVGQAMGGMLSLCGDEDGYPYMAGNGIADSITATNAALAIVAALFERKHSGEGQHVDVSLMDAVFASDCAAAPTYVASRGEHSVPRGGRFHHLACPWGVFKGPGESFLVIQAPGDIPWQRLATCMGRPELIDHPDFATMGARLQNRAKVHDEIEAFLQSFPSAEDAHKALADAKVIAGVVLDPWQVANHPQVTSRAMVREVPYPFTDPVPTIATAPHFSRSAVRVGRAPFRGEHNRAVLAELAGLGDDDVDRLLACGAVHEDPVVPHLGQHMPASPEAP
jgi:crotonobetainyl-CoA:carnitine CoA-transferase CaiB-like acyl-CoA transferase